MALFDATLVIAATAVRDSITHVQAHSADPGAAGTTAAVGSRTASTGTVDSDGDITWVVPFTGLPANQVVPWVSYWSAGTGGTCRGTRAISGDAANGAGALTATVVENNNNA